jgi:hypothetical protein
MSRKILCLMICFIFSITILAACTKLPQTSEVISPPTVKPTEVEVITTSTITPKETEQVPTPAQEPFHLLLIGDSSLSFLSETLPPLIERDLGVKVVVDDHGASGLGLNSVLQYLRTGKSDRSELIGLSEAISNADMVVFFVGDPAGSLIPGNQFNQDGCISGDSPPENCNPASLEQYTTDLKWIWGEIFKLRNGQPIILRTMDLYSAVINQYKENGILLDCTRCFENYSNAIHLAAEAYHIPFIRRYDIYNGVNHDEDAVVKGYIWEDGMHPSKLSAQVIAELLSTLGYEPIPPP